jgi:hypothetical protein
MGSRTLLSFKVNGHLMGDVVELTENEHLEAVLKVAGREIIDRIEIVMNGEIVFTKQIGSPETVLKWRSNCVCGNRGYLFARIHLCDKRKVWSSPVQYGRGVYRCLL